MRLQAINNFLVWAAITAIWLILLLSLAPNRAAGAWSNMGKAPTPELGSFGVGHPGDSFALNEFGGTETRALPQNAPALFLRQALDPAILVVEPEKIGGGGV